MSNNTDVIIIGAGIVGATCAWRLALAGLRVTVLERNAPGSEASQAALGVLTFHAKSEMPLEFNQLCQGSRQFYPAIIEELSATIGERPDYGAGGQLLVALTEADLPTLDAVYEVNRALGIEVERPTPDECRLLAPGINPNVCASIFFPDDAWVDNTALTLAIVRAAEQAGAVFERANVEAVESGAGRVTGVRWAGQLRSAEWIVIAAGCWSGEISGVPPLPVVPVRGQALAVTGQPVRRVVMSPRGYVVPKGDGQTLIGATVEQAGYAAVNTLAGLSEVSAAGLEISPALGTGEFLGAWAGLRPATPDNLPFIGPFDELPNLIAATGHFRNGILLAPITAAMVRSAVAGEAPPLDLQPFLPGRGSHLIN
jgi:glycine oxidase